ALGCHLRPSFDVGIEGGAQVTAKRVTIYDPGLLGDVVDRHALGCHLRPSFDADVATTVGSMLPEPTATGGNQGRPDSGGAGAHQGWPGASRQGEAPGLRATGPPGYRASGPPGHRAARPLRRRTPWSPMTH